SGYPPPQNPRSGRPSSRLFVFAWHLSHCLGPASRLSWASTAWATYLAGFPLTARTRSLRSAGSATRGQGNCCRMCNGSPEPLPYRGIERGVTAVGQIGKGHAALATLKLCGDCAGFALIMADRHAGSLHGCVFAGAEPAVEPEYVLTKSATFMPPRRPGGAQKLLDERQPPE